MCWVIVARDKLSSKIMIHHKNCMSCDVVRFANLLNVETKSDSLYWMKRFWDLIITKGPTLEWTILTIIWELDNFLCQAHNRWLEAQLLEILEIKLLWPRDLDWWTGYDSVSQGKICQGLVDLWSMGKLGRSPNMWVQLFLTILFWFTNCFVGTETSQEEKGCLDCFEWSSL